MHFRGFHSKATVCRMYNTVAGQNKHQNGCQKRNGRSKRRWRDELERFMKDWNTAACNHEKWKEWREAFTQQVEYFFFFYSLCHCNLSYLDIQQ